MTLPGIARAVIGTITALAAGIAWTLALWVLVTGAR